MNFFKQLPSNSVFLLPVVALVVGLISVDAANDRAQALYDARFQERLEADASLRLMIRNFAIETASQDFDELVSLMSARSFEGIDILNDPATETLVNSYGERLSSQYFHLIVGAVADGGKCVCEIRFPPS